MKIVTDAGAVIAIGTTETAPTVGITDYSRRVTDDFGVTTVVRRGFARRLSLRFAVPFVDAGKVQAQLADLRATPALWVADDRYRALSVRGLYKDFDVDLAVPPMSYCSLTVEGLAENDLRPDPGGDPAPEGQVSALRMVQPVAVTDDMLIASNVAEDDAPRWSASVTYPDAARVIVGHAVYESLVSTNIGNDPAGASGKWIEVGPTNRWAAFDQALGTATSAAGPIVVTLATGAADTVALLDVTGATVRVQAGGYDRTLAAGPAALVFDGLTGGALTVTIAGGGTVAVGTLLIGRMVALGVTEASPTAGITDYSRKEVDDFGEVTIVQRAWSKRMQARALIRSDAVDTVFDRIAAVRAVPALWIGDAGNDALTIYGFFKDFSIEIGEGTSKLSLAIEGLSKAAKVEPLKTSVDWPNVGDPDGTKPTNNADKTSENTSKDTAAVGGRPVGVVLDTLDAIEPIVATYPKLADDVSALGLAKVGTDAALASLDRATVDHAAALAQAERDAGRIGETLLRLLAESDRTRQILRDAGIVVDPATGVVRIYAIDQLADRTASAEVRLDAATATITTKASVDYVREQIALAVLDPSQAAQLEPIIARLTSAEQTISGLNAAVSSKAEVVELTRVSGRVTTVETDLDALAGTVSTKASRTDVDAQSTRIGLVEQTLSTLDGVSSFGVTVRQARAVADGAAEAGLRALLAGDEANRRQIVQQAEVRSEFNAKLIGQAGAEAAARTILSAAIGATDARAVQETVARVAGDSINARDIAALSVTSGQQAAAIATLSDASITAGRGIAGITTTIRQQAATVDATGEGLLRALIAGDNANRARAAQLVQVQTELSTTLIANEQASAVARQALLVRMGAAEAAIVTTTRALADMTASLIERITAAEAVVAHPTTGLAATRAELLRIEKASADEDAAIVEVVDALSAQVNDDITGLPATRAQQVVDRQARADGDSANATAIEAIEALVTDPESGLPAAHAAVTGLASAVATGDEANARLIQQVSAKLGDLGAATVQDLIEAVVDATGKILATRTTAIDINGNLVGTQLIGSAEGPGTLNLINADLRMGTGRVVFDNGTVMRVQGTGFGKARDLIAWFGPSMPVANCTRANAVSYEATNGDAYFGGSLSAGTIKNAVRTTSPAADSLTTGDIGSNGGTRTIVMSFAFSRRAASGSAAAGSGASSAVIVLRRYGLEIGRLNATGGYITSQDDQAAGLTDRYVYSEAVGGSITVSDQSGGSTVEYSAHVLSRSFGPGPNAAEGVAYDDVSGSIAIIETEE